MDTIIDSIMDAYDGNDPWAYEDTIKNTSNNEEEN